MTEDMVASWVRNSFTSSLSGVPGLPDVGVVGVAMVRMMDGGEEVLAMVDDGGEERGRFCDHRGVRTARDDE